MNPDLCSYLRLVTHLTFMTRSVAWYSSMLLIKLKQKREVLFFASVKSVVALNKPCRGVELVTNVIIKTVEYINTKQMTSHLWPLTPDIDCSNSSVKLCPKDAVLCTCTLLWVSTKCSIQYYLLILILPSLLLSFLFCSFFFHHCFSSHHPFLSSIKCYQRSRICPWSKRNE